jgi:ribose transport system substrate-binding protein
MVAAGIDLLVTSPLDGEMMAPAIARIYQSGIPVVLLSRGVRGDAYTAYFHTDDREIGRKSARFIASGLKGSGRVLMLKGPPGATTTQQRTEGFLAEMERFPGIAVTERTAHYLTAEAIKQTENVLAEKIPFDAVYAQNDFMARGAVMALEAHGIDPKKLIITGVDYTRIGREMIRLGQMAASFPYPTMAAEGARAVRDILAGKSVPKESVIQAPMVTRENVERHTPIF